MDYHQLFAIAAAGLDAQRLRLQAATLNLANADTVQSAQGGSGSWRPLRAVVRPALREGGFGGLFAAMATLPEARLEALNSVPRRVHEPTHPAADAEGFVTYPGIDTVTERLTMLSAARAYEANLATLSIGRSLVLKTLEIGGR